MNYTKMLLVMAAVCCHHHAVAQWSLTGNAGTTNSNFLGTTDNLPLILRTNNLERFRIDASGNLGIGTQTPRGVFDVQKEGEVYLTASPDGGGTGSTHSVFLSGHVYLAPYGTSDISYLQARRLNNLGTTELRIRTYDNNNLVEAVHVSGKGNVGIGNLQPAERLSVTGNAIINGTSPYMKINNRLTLQTSNTPVNDWARAVVSSNIYWVEADSKWRVSSAEFGTFDDFSMMRFENAGSIGFYTRYFSGGTGSYDMTEATLGGYKRMFIDNAGNVGIGAMNNDTKGYRLAVNGNAIFTSVKVKQYGSWPDYVFNKDYQFPSLAELEEYIRQNKHLPGVPSATEIEKEGLDVGDNQATLLKKIEELTLYIIQQNKDIQKMKAEISSLKNKTTNTPTSKQ